MRMRIFTPDDTASFLALITEQPPLVQDNLLSNATSTSSNPLAKLHTKNSAIYLSNS
jgi:hypothetical protein